MKDPVMKQVMTVKDTKAEAYLVPFFTGSIGEALRSFGDAVADVNHPFNKHPEDYVLFHIGSYGEQTGMITPLEAPKSLGVALDFVKSE